MRFAGGQACVGFEGSFGKAAWVWNRFLVLRRLVDDRGDVQRSDVERYPKQADSKEHNQEHGSDQSDRASGIGRTSHDSTGESQHILPLVVPLILQPQAPSAALSVAGDHFG
ncbi:hypothetical protein [Amycolatopsis taiwanensis]|uniref:hypothetical protein n=1 Tax=Amycolatopsis taiwanensis TaxID=342230 RepID=UPI0012EC55A3|nr:hypothetical protein [Amycolatopsis taiwanensis]